MKCRSTAKSHPPRAAEKKEGGPSGKPLHRDGRRSRSTSPKKPARPEANEEPGSESKTVRAQVGVGARAKRAEQSKPPHSRREKVDHAVSAPGRAPEAEDRLDASKEAHCTEDGGGRADG